MPSGVWIKLQSQWLETFPNSNTSQILWIKIKSPSLLPSRCVPKVYSKGWPTTQNTSSRSESNKMKIIEPMECIFVWNNSESNSDWVRIWDKGKWNGFYNQLSPESFYCLYKCPITLAIYVFVCIPPLLISRKEWIWFGLVFSPHLVWGGHSAEA